MSIQTTLGLCGQKLEFGFFAFIDRYTFVAAALPTGHHYADREEPRTGLLFRQKICALFA